MGESIEDNVFLKIIHRKNKRTLKRMRKQGRAEADNRYKINKRLGTSPRAKVDGKPKRIRKDTFINPPDEATKKDILSQHAIFEAQALYMRYVPIARISRETGLAVCTIQNFAYGENGWKKEREKLHAEVNEEIKQTSVAQIKKATLTTVGLINQGLDDFIRKIRDEGRAPHLGEVDMLTGVFSKLHKAKILEEVDDDQKKKLGLTPLDVLRALGSDPYLKKAFESANVIDVPDEALVIEEESVIKPDKDSASLAYPDR